MVYVIALTAVMNFELEEKKIGYRITTVFSLRPRVHLSATALVWPSVIVVAAAK